jgi:hypothetical protein
MFLTVFDRGFWGFVLMINEFKAFAPILEQEFFVVRSRLALMARAILSAAGAAKACSSVCILSV